MPAFNELARATRTGAGARAKIVMAMDRPRESWLKDHATRLRKRGFLRQVDMVFVAGERCREFARFLGFEERQIRRGTYGVDFEGLAPVARARQDRASAGGGWPRAFVYIGRYAPEKDLATLLAGYAKYRSMVESPWALNSCGKGDLASLLRGRIGVTDLGFVQPRDQPRLLGEQGVSVLVSRFEPWGAVVAEAAAAGLPVICSSAVGASVELVQPYHNGLVVAPGDIRAVARAMRHGCTSTKTCFPRWGGEAGKWPRGPAQGTGRPDGSRPARTSWKTDLGCAETATGSGARRSARPGGRCAIPARRLPDTRRSLPRIPVLPQPPRLSSSQSHRAARRRRRKTGAA